MNDDEIVALLQAGMRAEGDGEAAEAGRSWTEAWECAEGSYQRGIAAHYVARLYANDPQEQLGWNLICLEELLLVENERDIGGFFASAHACVGSSYLELGDLQEASHHLRAAQDKLAYVRPGPYRETVESGIRDSLDHLARLRGTSGPDVTGVSTG